MKLPWQRRAEAAPLDDPLGAMAVKYQGWTWGEFCQMGRMEDFVLLLLTLGALGEQIVKTEPPKPPGVVQPATQEEGRP